MITKTKQNKKKLLLKKIHNNTNNNKQIYYLTNYKTFREALCYFRRTWWTSPPNRSGWYQIPLAFSNTGIDSGQCLLTGDAVCDCRGHYNRTLDDIYRGKTLNKIIYLCTQDRNSGLPLANEYLINNSCARVGSSVTVTIHSVTSSEYYRLPESRKTTAVRRRHTKHFNRIYLLLLFTMVCGN